MPLVRRACGYEFVARIDLRHHHRRPHLLIFCFAPINERERAEGRRRKSIISENSGVSSIGI